MVRVARVVARECRWRRMFRPVARPERWMISVLMTMGGSWMREGEEEDERWRLRRERLV